MFTVRDFIMLAIGAGSTYAIIRFLPIIIQDLKVAGYKVWDYIRNELIKFKV